MNWSSERKRRSDRKAKAGDRPRRSQPAKRLRTWIDQNLPTPHRRRASARRNEPSRLSDPGHDCRTSVQRKARKNAGDQTVASQRKLATLAETRSQIVKLVVNPLHFTSQSARALPPIR